MRMLLFVAALLALALSACGQNGEDDVFAWEQDAENPFYGESLTVAVFGCQRTPRLAQLYMDANPGVVIEVVQMVPIRYTLLQRDLSPELEIAREQLRTQLLGGQAPLLIQSSLVNWQHRDFFVDWMPLIEAHPGFTDEAWFMEAFCAMAEYDGFLLAFPTGISYFYFSANSTVPGLAEEFAGRDSISMSGLIALYEAFGGLDSGLSMIPSNIPPWYEKWFSADFIDFQSGHVNFQSPEFVALLETAGQISKPITDSMLSDIVSVFDAGGDLWEPLAAHFMFMLEYATVPLNFSLLDGESVFKNPVPFVDEHGRLLVEANDSDMWSLSRAATGIQQALALDFIRFAQDTTEPDVFAVQPAMVVAGLFHLNRARLEYHTGEGVIYWLRFRYDRLLAPMDETLERKLERIAKNLEREMTGLPVVPQGFLDFFDETLEYLRLGFITSHEAAARLQNRAALQIMEGN